MKLLIVANKGGKTHGVQVFSHAVFSRLEVTPEVTLCRRAWLKKKWKTVKTYLSVGKAKRAISCELCLRAMEKKK